jgi:hypothetical protein
MAKLSGQEVEKLAKILTTALSFDDLQSFVYASTGDQLYDEFVAQGQPKTVTIRKLLIALEEQGTTADFLTLVWENRPGRPEVRREIASYFPDAAARRQKKLDLSAQTAGKNQADAPQNAFAPGFQRNVRPYLPAFDPRVWQAKMVRVQHRVCRLEIDSAALGTGFLVGADAVLTNWHVLEFAKNESKIDKLVCRFDYLRLPDDEVQPGELIKLDATGILDTSPYSAAEKTAHPDDPLPTMEELDYALLRLARRIGEEQVEGELRGWISLPTRMLPLPVDAPILILQHPLGSPMKLALDTQGVIGLTPNGARLRYRTNTDPGSSGSPVLTMDWDIVALHHYGDPTWQNPVFNQGVPINLIRQSIEKHGRGAALGL